MSIFKKMFAGRSEIAQPVETDADEWKNFLTADELQTYDDNKISAFQLITSGVTAVGMLAIGVAAIGAVFGGPALAASAYGAIAGASVIQSMQVKDMKNQTKIREDLKAQAIERMEAGQSIPQSPSQQDIESSTPEISTPEPPEQDEPLLSFPRMRNMASKNNGPS